MYIVKKKQHRNNEVKQLAEEDESVKACRYWTCV